MRWYSASNGPAGSVGQATHGDTRPCGIYPRIGARNRRRLGRRHRIRPEQRVRRGAGSQDNASVVECDVTFTKDRQAGLPPRPVRPAHHHQHPADAAARPSVPSRSRPPSSTPTGKRMQAADGRVLHQRPHGGRVQDAQGQDGRLRTPRPHAAASTRAAPPTGAPTSTPTASGHLLTHKESIELFRSLGAKLRPSSSRPTVDHAGQRVHASSRYAQKMIDEYKAAGISPRRVWPQSFNIHDVLYWVNNEPAFGRQAVYLDDANVVADLPSFAELVRLHSRGHQHLAPPTFALLDLDAPEPHRAVAVRPGRQGGGTRHHRSRTVPENGGATSTDRSPLPPGPLAR